jgi:transposase-like protein
MTPPADPARYKNHRFPGEIISHGVWLYYRFPLSYRDMQELLCERGIDVTYEAIRQWCLKFGQGYANQLRHRRAQPGDKWHLDEVFLTINGERHYLWRAVDQDGNVLDILVQSRRNKQAAKKFFRKLLKGLLYVPRVIITENLAPSGRTLIVSLLHRAPTLRTGDDGKRPYHDIFDLSLMLADTATIAVPAALADPHPGQFLGRALLGVHTVLA